MSEPIEGKIQAAESVSRFSGSSLAFVLYVDDPEEPFAEIVVENCYHNGQWSEDTARATAERMVAAWNAYEEAP